MSAATALPRDAIRTLEPRSLWTWPTIVIDSGASRTTWSATTTNETSGNRPSGIATPDAVPSRDGRNAPRSNGAERRAIVANECRVRGPVSAVATEPPAGQAAASVAGQSAHAAKSRPANRPAAGRAVTRFRPVETQAQPRLGNVTASNTSAVYRKCGFIGESFSVGLRRRGPAGHRGPTEAPRRDAPSVNSTHHPRRRPLATMKNAGDGRERHRKVPRVGPLLAQPTCVLAERLCGGPPYPMRGCRLRNTSTRMVPGQPMIRGHSGRDRDRAAKWYRCHRASAGAADAAAAPTLAT